MDIKYLEHRFRATNYLAVAQIFLQSNFLLEQPLSPADIKPRLLGHWGTCPGINFVYACLKYFHAASASVEKPVENSQAISASESSESQNTFQFILGPGHGFPALQANLFLDGELIQADSRLKPNYEGLELLCKNFSFPGGFPSHSSPITPTVITEGGELGYALAAAYGAALGHPEKHIFVLLGDGEFETATTLASLNLPAILGAKNVIPILHLNGYKISGPTIFSRRSRESQNELLRGFGYTPLRVQGFNFPAFLAALKSAALASNPFIILESEKGATGPKELNGNKIAGNFLAHQVPLPLAQTDPVQLQALETWLKSYHFSELFNKEKGFTI